MITLNANTPARDTADITKKYKKKSQSAEVWHRLRRNKAAMLGLVVAILLILMAIFSSTLYDYETQVINQDIPNRLQPPSWEIRSARMSPDGIYLHVSCTAPDSPFP